MFFYCLRGEVVITEELELDLIRVVRDSNPLFKYQLIYKAGNATGLGGGLRETGSTRIKTTTTGTR